MYKFLVLLALAFVQEAACVKYKIVKVEGALCKNVVKMLGGYRVKPGKKRQVSLKYNLRTTKLSIENRIKYQKNCAGPNLVRSGFGFPSRIAKILNYEGECENCVIEICGPEGLIRTTIPTLKFNFSDALHYGCDQGRYALNRKDRRIARMIAHEVHQAIRSAVYKAKMDCKNGKRCKVANPSKNAAA